MIHGIGVDIVKTERMRAAVQRWGDRFLHRVFTPDEISYAYSKNQPHLSLSVRFAAKEALVKALGGAVAVSFREIEVNSNPLGRPSLQVKGRLEEFFRSSGITCAHVSLSHERDYGIACVVLEGGR